MKKTLTRLAVILAIVAVLSIYVLYVLENLPSILQKSGKKYDPDSSRAELLPETGADDEQVPSDADDTASIILSDDKDVLSDDANALSDDANAISDDTETYSTEHDNTNTYGNEPRPDGESAFENGGLGPDDASLNQSTAVEDETWRAVNRSESYNNELQYYTQDNVILKDGSITIISKKEKRGTKNYTSGMVTSKFGYLYGFFSFRIRVPEGKGLFPAIWLLPVEDKKLPEIDIFEMIGSEPLDFYGVIHYGSPEQPKREYFCRKVKKKEFYEVGIKWTKNELSWYIDNQRVFTTNKGIPNEPMYLIINQAIGGDWPGTPDDAALPATFIIESYKLEPELIISL
ncbi:MAG TPA: glycoside hydrolase family 16 protein [Clostridiaceae bacterium]|nr:glycoside hydrolase family 16 protein [Clostridiaceae bacterium]